MLSSPSATAIFWALLLLLTNILPGSPADAHGCRQLQVTKWRSDSISDIRNHHDPKEVLPNSDLKLCRARAWSSQDRDQASRALLNDFKEESATNSDQCLNLKCATCVPTVNPVGTRSGSGDAEYPVFDELNHRCWIPMASIQLWRCHTSDDVKFVLKNGTTQNCKFDNVVNRLKDTYDAVMVDEFLMKRQKFSDRDILRTIRTEKNPASTIGINKDVKCK
ncbi:hypothetical protein BCR37DRAFT_41148 [Protomyces lactucae-debilis]|uniref:Uncharacterized protein n=1 Tax=Protomyces lactucae-debilis TaxID=2754530 RepID=A0A1Y2FBP9_PROLT|nr:uncharacterized protein BCR37DRAFT_41148 [Protomyces lactucae-debilis]ORY81339.1 hypothetical protein BCR37DRAFT_41148 [Protomyces lactucae-debilis]